MPYSAFPVSLQFINDLNMKVRAKKSLGQHFLKDITIARRITDSLTGHGNYQQVLEIGPGMGVLTNLLLSAGRHEIKVVDIDRDAIAYLKQEDIMAEDQIIEADFLKMPLNTMFDEKLAIIGNFPYNISSQIFFKILAHRQQVTEVVGMLQKEVAERIASGPGNKTYGILSVLLQAYYKVELLFTVPPEVFQPPPKVQSAVVRLMRNNTQALACNEAMFFRVVKQAFQMRRKTLRNSLKPLGLSAELSEWALLSKRAEQLSVYDFEQLTLRITADNQRNKSN